MKHDRTRVAGSCRHTFQLETVLNSPRMLTGLSAGEKKAEKAARLCSSLPWIPEETRLKNKSKVTCRSQERYTAKLSGNALKTPSIGSI